MLSTCYSCKQALPTEAFCPSSLARRDYVCRACKVAANKKGRHANPERAKDGVRVRMRKWRERKNPVSERAAKRVQRQIENFWSKVRRDDGCWIWTAFTNDQGYGVFGIGGRQTMLAPRFSWQLANGPIPQGLNVLHKCDNPPCVRPDHLFLGTRLDNARDREQKGRGNQPRGERNAQAKLTNVDIVAIRSLQGTLTQVQIAERFGVTQTTIGNILRGETWRHVNAG